MRRHTQETGKDWNHLSPLQNPLPSRFCTGLPLLQPHTVRSFVRATLEGHGTERCYRDKASYRDKSSDLCDTGGSLSEPGPTNRSAGVYFTVSWCLLLSKRILLQLFRLTCVAPRPRALFLDLYHRQRSFVANTYPVSSRCWARVPGYARPLLLTALRVASPYS